MVVARFNSLAQLLEHQIHVLFLTGKKNPPGLGVEPLRILFDPGRCVGGRVDRDGKQQNIAVQTVSEPVLNGLHVAVQERTYAYTFGEECVDHHNPVFQQVAIEAHIFAVLVHEDRIGEITLGGGILTLLGGRRRRGCFGGLSRRRREDCANQQRRKKNHRRVSEFHGCLRSRGVSVFKPWLTSSITLTSLAAELSPSARVHRCRESFPISTSGGWSSF